MKNKSEVITNSSYRPEIDGIRALAIITVIINHFNKEFLPSGYLGVDIFFVISGFVITSSFFGKPKRKFREFILGFYERRVKRLVPALIIFTITISIFISIFSNSPGESLKTGLASLFGLSNIYLFQLSTNYFASYTELNTFTHTWSLGVEEQFYLIFPFLIWFSGYCNRGKNSVKKLFFLILIFAVPSLIGFLYFYSTNQSAAYFLMPFRFWEMALGCLLFLGFQKRSSIFLFLEKFPPLLVTALIIGIMFLPNINLGISTVLIVFLTLILIACLKNKTKTYKLFTKPKIIYIGKLSYSLYLWHWGILAISRWTIGIYWWTIPIQALLILVISIISYKFIETPLRRKNWYVQKWLTIVISGGLISLVSGFIYLLAKPLKGYLFIGQFPVYSVPKHNKCILPKVLNKIEKSNKIPPECGYLDLLNAPTIYGIGDSHIGQFGHAISSFSEKYNYNYALIWQPGCFSPASVIQNNNNSCYENQSRFEKILINNISKGDIVFIGNYLYALIDPNPDTSKIYYDNFGEKVSKTKASEIYKINLEQFTEDIINKGGKVIFFVDSLIFPSLNLPGVACTREWFRNSNNIIDNCKSSLSSHIAVFNKYFKWREDWKDSKNKFLLNAYLYSKDCEGDICYASRYTDGNHFDARYAKEIFDNFLKENPHLLKSTSKIENRK